MDYYEWARLPRPNTPGAEDAAGRPVLSTPVHPSLVGGYVLTEEDDRCADERCHHPRYAHTGQSGRCVEGAMKHTAAWRCQCRGFVTDDEGCC